MDVSIKQEADSIVEDYQTKSRQKIKAEEGNKLFLDNFYLLRDNMISPAMEEISDYLAKKNFITEILVTEEDKSKSTSISFIFTFDFDGVDEMKFHYCPYLTISPRGQEFILEVSIGKIGGSYSSFYSDERDEPYKIKDFNREAIQKKLLEIFKLAC